MTDIDEFDDEEELDLSTLPDDELTEQMHDDLYNGLKEEIEEGTHILLDRGWVAVPGSAGGAGRGHANRRYRLSATVFCSCRRCCWQRTP